MPPALRVAVATCLLLAGLNTIAFLSSLGHAISGGIRSAVGALLVLTAVVLFLAGAIGLRRRRRVALLAIICAIASVSVVMSAAGINRGFWVAQMLHAITLGAALFSWPHLGTSAVGA
jgi:glucan phosphoethanolaminetransferase (alkaline phosphatase superfamily)